MDYFERKAIVDRARAMLCSDGHNAFDPQPESTTGWTPPTRRTSPTTRCLSDAEIAALIDARVAAALGEFAEIVAEETAATQRGYAVRLSDLSKVVDELIQRNIDAGNVTRMRKTDAA